MPIHTKAKRAKVSKGTPTPKKRKKMNQTKTRRKPGKKSSNGTIKQGK